jgi:hypothetical protein
MGISRMPNGPLNIFPIVAKIAGMKTTTFNNLLQQVRDRNAARLIQTARLANTLAKIVSGRNRRLFYGVKTRAVDQMIARMGLLTDVGDISIDGDAIVGVRFTNAAWHVKFSQLSEPSQSMVVAKLTAALAMAASPTGGSLPNFELSGQTFASIEDFSKASQESTHQPATRQVRPEHQTVGAAHE